MARQETVTPSNNHWEMPKRVAIISAVLSIKQSNWEINLVASVPLVFQINKKRACLVCDIEDSKSHMGLYLLHTSKPASYTSESILGSGS